MVVTIARWVHYATKRLRPLGARVSVDVFGSRPRVISDRQSPRRSRRSWTPSTDGLSLALRAGRYGLDNPVSVPGKTVGRSLRDFRRQMKRGKAELVPWLEDFSFSGSPTLGHVQDQIFASRRWKAGGFLLWNAAGVYTEGALTTP